MNPNAQDIVVDVCALMTHSVDPTKTFVAPPRFEPVILMVSPFVADAGLTVVVTGVFVLE